VTWIQFVNNAGSGIAISLVINSLNSREQIHQIVPQPAFHDFRRLEIESGSVPKDWLGEDAVSCELLSACKFPDQQGKYREFCDFRTDPAAWSG
jgi:hypothetical protein